MSNKRLDAISDYARHGYMLRVDCRSCGRVAIIDPQPLVQLCRRRQWSRQMNFVEARLRCTKCGARNVVCGPAFKKDASN